MAKTSSGDFKISLLFSNSCEQLQYEIMLRFYTCTYVFGFDTKWRKFKGELGTIVFFFKLIS